MLPKSRELPSTNDTRTVFRLARQFAAIGLRWARNLACNFPEGPPAESEFFQEILAFAVCRAEAAVDGEARPEHEAFLRLLRFECARLRGDYLARQAGRNGGYIGESGSPIDPRDSRVRRLCEANRGTRERKAFEQFCASTGLGADVLVGRKESVADLVFYIALHSVLAERGSVTRDEFRKLLALARGCRTELQGAIGEWEKGFKGLEESTTTMQSQPPRALQNGNPREK